MPRSTRGGDAPHVPELDRRRVGRLPRVVLALALALPVLLVAGVLVASNVLQRSAPATDTPRLAVRAVPVPAAASDDCARLISGLPRQLNTGGTLMPRRVLAHPAPPGTVAWGGERTGRPVVLRCGLARPAELIPTAPLLDVDGVQWVRVRTSGPRAAGSSTWVTADRAVYVGLTVPDGLGSGAIQDVSRGVKITLASRVPAG